MTKKAPNPQLDQARQNIKAAWNNLNELREHKLSELRQVDGKIAALNPAVDALFGKGRKA